MAHEHLTYDDLLRIVELIKSTEHFSEFRLKVGDIELELRHRKSGTSKPVAPLVMARTIESPVADTAGRAPSAGPATWPEGSVVIRSPMVGTFYRAPQPGAPPFVEVGQAVQPDSVVGIIEVMKLMNSITADVHGNVEQILVADAGQVEAGQPVIVIKPSLTIGTDDHYE
ncbi:MAG: acetyl-CoA carboxylase biotin carboxyl carrier protein [Burkholderiaceae bacterium]